MATKAPLAEDDRTYLQKWFAYIPNDYPETPRLVNDEEFAIHEPKVGKRFARLEVIGKFCTLAKYFSIVTAPYNNCTTSSMPMLFTKQHPM